jgi:hypothetical protein
MRAPAPVLGPPQERRALRKTHGNTGCVCRHCAIRKRQGTSASWRGKLAGPKAYPQRFAAACRLVAAQIDLLDIREARLPLLSRALEDRSAIKRLHSIDRYARYARSQRSRAIRDFGSARPPVSTSFGQTSCVDSCGDEIDIAAALRKPPLRKARSSPKLRIRTSRGRYLRFGQRSCSTNFNILPKQSQRGKIQIKQRFNMNSARRGR